MEVQQDQPQAGPSNGAGTSQFFNPTVGEDDALCSLWKGNHGSLDWKYEMRREAQEIVPGLYLGPAQFGKELSKLQAIGITNILIIRPNNEAHFIKPRFPELFQYLVLEASDSFDQVIIPLVTQSVQYISHTLQSGGKVYVHCGNGLSLSPAVTIAYLMAQHFMTYDQALGYLQGKRYCIAPNAHFAQQLKEFEAIYRAQAAMSRNPLIGTNQRILNTPTFAAGGSGNGMMGAQGGTVEVLMRKRVLDDDSDDDEPSSENKQPERRERATDRWTHGGNAMMEDD